MPFTHNLGSELTYTQGREQDVRALASACEGRYHRERRSRRFWLLVMLLSVIGMGAWAVYGGGR